MNTNLTSAIFLLSLFLSTIPAALSAQYTAEGGSLAGQVRIESTIPSTITLEGTIIGTATADKPLTAALPTGLHTLVIVREGQESVSRQVMLVAGSTVTLVVHDTPDEALPPPPPEPVVVKINRELGTAEAEEDPILVTVELGISGNLRGDSVPADKGTMDAGPLLGFMVANSKFGLGMHGFISAVQMTDIYWMAFVDTQFGVFGPDIAIRPGIGLGTVLANGPTGLVYGPGIGLVLWKFTLHLDFINFEYFGARPNPRFMSASVTWSVP